MKKKHLLIDLTMNFHWKPICLGRNKRVLEV